MAANEKDLVKLDAQEIDRPQPIMDIAQIMQKAEQMISITNRIKKACIQLTNENDWDNLGGKPYLEAAGAEKYILPFGIRCGKPYFEYEEFNDDKGFYYMYTCTVDVALPNGDTVSGVGTCDSRDRFFSKARGEDKELSEIEKGDIKKKAYTNARVNGIKFLLGLRNLSWDDLSEHGIDTSKLTKVEYKSGQKKTSKSNGKLITDKQKNRLFAIAKDKGISPEDAKKIIKKYGFESSSDITTDKYDSIISEIEKDVSKSEIPVTLLGGHIDRLSKEKWASVDEKLGKQITEWLEKEKQAKSPDDIDEKGGRELLTILENL